MAKTNLPMRAEDFNPAAWFKSVVETERLMRRYIRHPSSIPIHFSLSKSNTVDSKSLKDVSRGGLCFHSEESLNIGCHIHLEIPVQSPPFSVEALISWCTQDEAGGYTVGVEFDVDSTAYSVRMVEQVCYIEHYRATVKEIEGRELTSEEAAQEWVEKFADIFPH
ncbi:MAG: hypothetical protein ACI93R_000361 [Flavobacteriales bacterium]|jgi:hypothetical protein